MNDNITTMMRFWNIGQDRQPHPAWGSSSPFYQVSFYLPFVFILLVFYLKEKNLENPINIFLL